MCVSGVFKGLQYRILELLSPHTPPGTGGAGVAFPCGPRTALTHSLTVARRWHAALMVSLEGGNAEGSGIELFGSDMLLEFLLSRNSHFTRVVCAILKS